MRVPRYEVRFHNMKRRAYPGTQAVLRAISLLKAFTPTRPERGLAELAWLSGLNKTTVYRLLTALESEGMIQRGPENEAYRLGPELLALGSRALGAGDLRLASRAELRTLAQATRETATLEMLVDDDVLILDESMGGHVLGSMPSVGTRWPAHATSTGKVLLAHLPEQELDARLRRPRAALTAKTLTERSRLERELMRARKRGYATTTEELEPGFVAVAAPLRSATSAVVAAISVGGPRARLTPDRMADLARQLPAAAARISEQLGFRGAAREL